MLSVLYARVSCNVSDLSWHFVMARGRSSVLFKADLGALRSSETELR